MAFSVSPSVIIREVDATGSIPAVSNAPAAIAGVFNWGPLMEPVLITSETNLVSRFGRPGNQNAETFFTAADFLAYSNALYVTRVAEGAIAATYVGSSFAAKYAGSLGNSIGVSFVSGASNYSEVLFELGTLSGTVDFGARSLNVVSTTVGLELAMVNGDILRVGSSTIGYQALEIEEVTASSPDPVTGAITYTIEVKTPFALAETNLQNLRFSREWRYAGNVSGAPKENCAHIVVTDISGNISGTPGSIIEIYDNVSLTPGSKTYDGSSNYYVEVIENRSGYITTVPTVSLGTDVIGYLALTGGEDGMSEADVSFSAVALGYDTFKNSEEIDISFVLQGKAIGGVIDTGLANYILSNIVEYRKDCVLFVSPSFSSVVTPASVEAKLENILGFRSNVQSSSYWVMDSGYKYRYDKYNDVYRWVPLNGDIAGLSARVDPWESPAGYKRGILKNVVKLAYNPNKTHRDALFGSDINPVISQVGQGVMLFGDKTGLGTESAFNRINVRRLFITVEKAIATMSASFLFDFNDSFTQNQFKNTVVPYLENIQGKRGIIDFRVISDETINTPDVVDANTFKGNIFIKPARTISVIELTFVATRTGILFSEQIGQI